MRERFLSALAINRITKLRAIGLCGPIGLGEYNSVCGGKIEEVSELRTPGLVIETSVSCRNDRVGENTGEGEKHSCSTAHAPANLSAGLI